MDKRVYTRRDFLKHTVVAAAAGSIYMHLPARLVGGRTPGTRVVLIRHEEVLDSLNRPKAPVIQQMLDEAVTALLNVSDPLTAWKSLISPDDVVGVKTNSWNYLPTPDVLNAAIRQRVLDAGVPEKSVSVRDRGVRNDPVFQNATALINVRPLRSHHWAGVGTLIKNYIIFTPQPSAYHADACADLASIWKQPALAGKTRLNILVMLTPLFHGIGPHHYSPRYVWPYQGLLVGRDPVAVDSTGVRILQAKRQIFFGDHRPLNPPPKHIFLADTRHRLGTAEPAKINLIRLGWQDDVLI